MNRRGLDLGGRTGGWLAGRIPPNNRVLEEAMAQVEATTERIIAADPETVFDALADYTDTRPKVLTEHFSEYEVREGGDGEGTLVHWKLQATSKRTRDCLLEVTEPTDGRLVEKDRNSSMVTTWAVTPAGEGRSKAVVTTVWDGAGGIGGFFERTFAPKGLGRIYDAVLEKLATETEAKGAAAGPASGSAAGTEPETKPRSGAGDDPAQETDK
jgi:uncharacterized protein YndB with AHSA1/START domain